MTALKSPEGDSTAFLRNDRGDVIRRISPIDATDQVVDTIGYDAMARETYRRTYNSQDSVWTELLTSYDSAGRRSTAQPRGREPDASSLDSIAASEWIYDQLGRTVVEITGTTDSLHYDAAGNLIRRRTARGHDIRHYHDLLGRVDSTVVDSVVYPYETSTVAINYAPILEPNGLTIPREVSVFEYDEMGNLTSATNSKTEVTRTYERNGLLRTDKLALKEWSSSSMSTHVYELTNDYDLDGQRVAVHHPDWILDSGTDRTRYEYDDETGRLTSVTGPLGTTFTLGVDSDGLLTTREFPGGADSLAYDGDHRLIRHHLSTGGELDWADTLTYDFRGKVTSVGTSYTGLGFVEDPGDLEWGLTSNLNTETFSYNGLGQALTKEVRYAVEEGEGFPDGEFASTYRAEGGLAIQEEQWPNASPATNWEPYKSQHNYDESGNVWKTVTRNYAWEFTTDSVGATKLATFRTDTRSYYSADQRLTVRQADRDTVPHHPQQFQGDTLNVNWGAYEEYWYDALGRRVLKRSYQQGLICDWIDRCDSTIDRFVWDGEQILWELRAANTSDAKNPSEASNRGTVGYIHGGGIDAPLGLVRGGAGSGSPVILHRNWRQLFAFATDTLGEPTTCAPDGEPFCDKYPWPGASPYTYLESSQLPETHLWYGSLPLDQRDESGLAYRRNRYYDPAGAQFTQTDPIGIAGGLNAYGYANGDPINFSDPFGLCPPDDTNLQDCPIETDEQRELLRAYAFLKARGGESWLKGLVDLGVEVTVTSDPNACAGASRGCSNSVTGAITLESASDHAETGTRLVHELTHSWLRGQPQWCSEREEVIAWKNALNFYEQSGANVPFYETRLKARNANASAFFSTFRGTAVC